MTNCINFHSPVRAVTRIIKVPSKPDKKRLRVSFLCSMRSSFHFLGQGYVIGSVLCYVKVPFTLLRVAIPLSDFGDLYRWPLNTSLSLRLAGYQSAWFGEVFYNTWYHAPLTVDVLSYFLTKGRFDLPNQLLLKFNPKPIDDRLLFY